MGREERSDSPGCTRGGPSLLLSPHHPVDSAELLRYPVVIFFDKGFLL